MKHLKDIILERLVLSKTKKSTHTLFPETKEELEEMIKSEIKNNGNNCNLNHIDVSKITNMRFLFGNIGIDRPINHFNGDISEWDVSNVEDMGAMFSDSKFNGDISKWDVSNVTNMEYMFNKAEFTGENGDISNWNVSNVKRMAYMFCGSLFNSNISKWNVSSTADTRYMFRACPLQNNPPKWYRN